MNNKLILIVGRIWNLKVSTGVMEYGLVKTVLAGTFYKPSQWELVTQIGQETIIQLLNERNITFKLNYKFKINKFSLYYLFYNLNILFF